MAVVSRLPIPCLTLITDRRLCREPSTGSGQAPSGLSPSGRGLPLAEAVAEAVGGGVNVVQLREKDLPANELLRLAKKLRAAIQGRALFLVNDSLDVALACGADGVHLPERGLPVAAARRLAGGPFGRLRAGCFVVGRSVHSVEEARRAQDEGADYVQVGAIFASRSHPDAPPAGLTLLEEVARAVSIPILAVGGITADNVGQAVGAGASGAAVISAILGAPSPGKAARRLAEALAQALRQAQGRPGRRRQRG